VNFFARRRWKKTVRRALHEARHIRHMRMDIADPAAVAAVEQAGGALQAAWQSGQENGLNAALEALDQAVVRLAPPHRHPGMRENVEILVVALGVAMAFRSYFIQPFKIPTGSMQPTLNGITVQAEHQPTLLDVFPVNFLKRLTVGERYVETVAPASGRLMYIGKADDVWQVIKAEQRSPLLPLQRILAWLRGNTPPGPVQVYLIGGEVQSGQRVGGRLCFVHPDMKMFVQPGDTVKKGQRLASGLVRAGDHIFVNRLVYNFRRPRRGDIFVFSTRDIRYPGVRTDNYYIKRLVGLPNESIALAPPYLMADGKKVTDPYAFRRQVEGEGYHGYRYPEVGAAGGCALGSHLPPLALGPRDYLPMGDNTLSSLDGRYFGPVDRSRIIGPAFVVYWPFGAHWGRVQ